MSMNSLKESTEKPKAYSYIRMSTKEQLEGDSRRRQLAKTRQYAEEKGLDLVENYRDIGVSAYRGANAAHGALRRFIDAVDDGEISKGSYLIIESMDRLTRETAVTAIGLLSEIVHKGITVVTLDDRVEYSSQTFASSQSHLFIAIGSMIRSHEESRRKSGLLSEVWDQKRQQLRSSGAPMTARLPAWLRLDRQHGTIVEIPERVKIVREIFDLACNGYGAYSIAAMLNERGEKAWGRPKKTKVRVTTREGLEALWGVSYIKKLLANKAVLGIFQPHRQEVTEAKVKLRVPEGQSIEGYYPQVISPEVFRAATLAIERRRTSSKGRKGRTYANIFTGLLFCAHCGSGMRFIDKGKPPRGGKYLRCSRNVCAKGCIAKSYRYEVVEDRILSFLENLDVERVLGGASLARRVAEKRHQLELIEIDIAALSGKIQATLKAVTAEQAQSSSLVSTLREMERDETKLRATQERLKNEVAEAESIDPAKRREALVALLRQISSDADEEKRVRARRALAGELHRLVDRIVISPIKNFAFELDEVDASWRKTYERTTQSRLEKYLEDYGFEVSIRYRNGVQQVLGGLNQGALRIKWSRRFSDLHVIEESES